MTLNEQKRISYSEFKNWKECPWRHKLIHIDKVSYYEGNEFTAFGTSIHKMCEITLLDDLKKPTEVFNTTFDEELKHLSAAGATINNSLVLEMKIQAENICNQVKPALHKYFNKFEIFSVEESLMEDMNEIKSFGKKFKGFIDMIIKTEDGRYHIIDWKTCSWGWPSQKKSDPVINYQLTFYKNFFCKKHNIDPKKVDTYFGLLKRTAKKENVEILRTTSGPKKTTNALKILENAVINIDKGNYIKNRLNCKYCKFYKTEKCK